jgi:hypothetical protein
MDKTQKQSIETAGRWAHQPHAGKGFPWFVVGLVAFTWWLTTLPVQ